jgi:hypothetical protein
MSLRAVGRQDKFGPPGRLGGAFYSSPARFRFAIPAWYGHLLTGSAAENLSGNGGSPNRLQRRAWLQSCIWIAVWPVPGRTTSRN